MSIALGKVLDQSGYLRDLREERSEEAQGRIENLMELVSAAREYETREPEPSLGGFVDRLSLLSDVDKEQGSRDARVLLMTLHSAKGLEFPVVVIAGLEEGLFPHSRAAEDEAELEEERRLCYVGHHAGAVAPGADERRAPARVRRLPGHPAVAVPRRDPGRPGRAGVRGAYSSPYAGTRGRLGIQGQSLRTRRPRRSRTPRAREEATIFDDAQEDQSDTGALAPGRKVRHGQFGLGTVVSVEELDDDMKLVVRFASVGTKTLRARYAKLELA